MLIKQTVLRQDDKKAAAQRIVPILMAIMAWAFTTYLILKGLKKIIKIEFPMAVGLGFAAAIVVYFLVKMIITKRASKIKNTRKGHRPAVHYSAYRRRGIPQLCPRR